MIHVDIVSEPIRPQEWITWVKSPKAGAVIFFGGITRDSFGGMHVESLAYDAYVPRALKTLNSIATQAQQRSGIENVVLIHRIGVVPLSEESVCIVVASAHRKEGWSTAEWILEEVKSQAEIWKKEVFTDGSSKWVEGQSRRIDT